MRSVNPSFRVNTILFGLALRARNKLLCARELSQGDRSEHNADGCYENSKAATTTHETSSAKTLEKRFKPPLSMLQPV